MSRVHTLNDVGVRVSPSAPTALSSIGTGHHPLTVKSAVRFRVGLPNFLAGLPASSLDDRGEWFSKSAKVSVATSSSRSRTLAFQAKNAGSNPADATNFEVLGLKPSGGSFSLLL